MVDQPSQNQTDQDREAGSGGTGSGKIKRFNQLDFAWYRGWVRRCLIGLIASLLLLSIAICFDFVQQQFFAWGILEEEYCLVYLILTLAGSLVILDRYLMHETDVHLARLEDPSLVESIFAQASEYINSQDNGQSSPRVQNLRDEVSRISNLDSDDWTEHQILQLERILADFFSNSDLISKSTAKLSELNEYAQDSQYKYDIDDYYRWQREITNLIDQILAEKEKEKENGESEPASGEKRSTLEWANKRLTSEYKSLLGHITDYKQDWNEGSTIIKNLIICTVSSTLLFLIMGIVPLVYPESPVNLSIVHWGLLGSAGALTAVARDFRKTDLLAVGNTFGKKELWRAILGSVLGFIAGLILWSLIVGEVLQQGVFPNLNSSYPSLRDCALSVFWAIVAGFSFDRIFDQVRAQGDGAIR